jgi:hypothetical protein
MNQLKGCIGLGAALTRNPPAADREDLAHEAVGGIAAEVGGELRAHPFGAPAITSAFFPRPSY